MKFPILWDASRETVQKYGVLNGKLAHPATFVIDADGIIRWKRVDQDYTNRASAQTILAQVRALSSLIPIKQGLFDYQSITFVVSLSNHERAALRQAQGERQKRYREIIERPCPIKPSAISPYPISVTIIVPIA